MDSEKKILRNVGLKATSARIAILSYLKLEHGPFSIDDLIERLDHNCDPSTLYRNLTKLLEANLIEVTDLGDGIRRYEFNPHNGKYHHHHVICEICKVVVKTNLCLPSQWQKNLEKLGYKNLRHRLEFFGVCKSCSAKSILPNF